MEKIEELRQTYIQPLLNRQETFEPQGFEHFIRREGAYLYDGDKPWRFMSVNLPSALYNSDGGNDDKWLRISPFEVEDQMKTVAAMGGECVRVFVLSVRMENESVIRHIYGPSQFDELMFRDFDLLLAYANKYKVRLIVPLINIWQSMGSNFDFDRWCGGDGTAYSFYHNPHTREKYKELLHYLFNRVNVYTGVRYKDDRAIAIWELGNELNHPLIEAPVEPDASCNYETRIGQTGGSMADEWAMDISAFIKKEAPNHLTMNGAQYDPTPAVLHDPNMDIIVLHYCWPLGFGSVPCSKTKITLEEFLEAKKAFIYGEFDPAHEINEGFLKECRENPLISGALAWSLRGHDKRGGYLCHNDFGYPSLRWPGFDNGMPDERERLLSIRETSYRMRGEEPPAILPPDPPTLLPIATPHAISFRGAVGADHYRIERAETPNGPWTLVDGEVQDCQYPFYEPFDDKGAAMDRDIYYRVTAIGLGGESAPGNVMPFIAAHPLIADMEEEIIGDLFVDECNGLEKLYQIENPEHICVAKSGSYHQYSFNSFVFSGPVAMTYRSAIDMQDCFVHIGWQGEGWRALTLEVSRDGEHFVPAAASLRDYGECDGRHFGRLEAFPLPAGIRFLKIRVQPALELETLEVSRVEYTGGLVYED